MVINKREMVTEVMSVWKLLWVVLLTLCLVSTVLFSCAEGVSKHKTATDAPAADYGGGCAACGGGCGA